MNANFWLYCIKNLLAAGSFSLLLDIAAAQTATIVFNTTADEIKAGDGDCSLREAINNANTNGDMTKGDCIAGSPLPTLDRITFNIQSTLPTTILGKWIRATATDEQGNTSEFSRRIQAKEITIEQDEDNLQKEADALMRLGEDLTSYEDIIATEGLELFEQALAIYQQIGDRTGEAQALQRLGELYYLGFEKPQLWSGEPPSLEQVLLFYQQAIKIYQELDDEQPAAALLERAGRIALFGGSLPQAIEFHDQYLNYKPDASSLEELGQYYAFMGYSQEAIRFYQQALLIYQANGEEQKAAEVRSQLELLSKAKKLK